MNAPELQQKRSRKRTIEIIVHFCVWAYMFSTPLIFRRSDESVNWLEYGRRLYFPLVSCIVFYVNYLWLVPRYFLTKRYSGFVLLNALLIAVLIMGRDAYSSLFPHVDNGQRREHFRHYQITAAERFLFTMRNVLSQLFTALLAVGVRLSLQWRNAEEARREAELARSEAELQNLKNQINPHFLLNTLNNIYALTAFDPEKAQQAIEELSRMLRYMLYENQTPYVSLRKETDFLNTYIALMRLRQSTNVDISVDFDIPPGDKVRVAPLIFISLVENAFKHGISPTHPSYIRLRMHADEREIRFECANSNFPKNESDKSPGGIGLKQVKARLEHTYPGRYSLRQGVNKEGTEFSSHICITIS